MGFNFPNSPTVGTTYNAGPGLPVYTWNGTAWVVGIGGAGTYVERSYLAGLMLSTAGSSATFSVAPGIAADNTNAAMMALAAAISKTTAAWTAGSGNGGLDTGTIANSTWYHVHLIKNPTTGAVDALISLSPTAPTLPSGFALFRRIGSIKTTSSPVWSAFHQYGDKFLWDTPFYDASGMTLGATSVPVNLNVPPGIITEPIFEAWASRPSASPSMFVRSPNAADIPPSSGGPNTMTDFSQVSGGFSVMLTNRRNLVTGLNSEIYFRADAAGTSLYISTFGWIDTRGRDA